MSGGMDNVLAALHRSFYRSRIGHIPSGDFNPQRFQKRSFTGGASQRSQPITLAG
jgi:hypothetical protein